MFSLLVVKGDFTGGLVEADGNFSVVGDAVRRALVVLIESQTSFPQHTVHILPRSTQNNHFNDVTVALNIATLWLVEILMCV